ncbi:hypothetical protein FQA39_LY10199 [Lamprigera yunnana]|nr:hypothetical protein FQA39_LY10199 [Lamprigera yunnana]
MVPKLLYSYLKKFNNVASDYEYDVNNIICVYTSFCYLCKKYLIYLVFLPIKPTVPFLANNMWAVILIVVLFFLSLIYFKRKNRYWYYKKVQGPQPTIFWGNFYDLVAKKKSKHGYINDLYKKYKSQGLKYFGMYMFTSPTFVIVELELIKKMLQTDFQYFTDRPVYVNEKNDPLTGQLGKLNNPKWSTLRTQLSPMFTADKMKMMFHTMLKCSHSLQNVVNCLGETNEPIDMKNIMSRFGTDVIVSCGLGLECNTLEDANCEFRNISDVLNTRSKLGVFKEFFFFSFPQIADFLKLKIYSDEFAKFFVKLATQTIEFRETKNIVREDFLQLLIQMKKDSKLNKETYNDSGLTLTVNEISAQVAIFLCAAYEKPATTVTFCLYELCLNEDIQFKLRKEIITVLAKYNGKITYEALMDMSYMDVCIKETLRKYPAVTTLTRTCTKTYKVPNSDVVLDKGTLLLISTLSIHMDEDYYPSPNTFNPNRFLTNEDNFTWFGFSRGPRNCIGLHFGMLQMKVALTTLLLNFKFSIHKNTEVPIPLNTIGSVKPMSKIWLTAEKVNQAS